jgi:AcrR family transcriptional regulator
MIAAFIDLVAARGYAALRPADVAGHAGLPESRFERHFADLDACFEAAWESLEAIFLERLAAAYRDAGGWRERLRAGLAETLALIEAHPAAARFLTIETLAGSEAERARQRRLAAHLGDLLDRATADLDPGPRVPPLAPNWILAMVFDCIYRHLASGNEAHLSEQLPQLMFLATVPYLGLEQGLAELDLSSD